MTRQRKGSKRQARRASIAAKRGGFSTGNKKPGIAPGFYTFVQPDALPSALEAIHSQATQRPMNNEIC